MANEGATRRPNPSDRIAVWSVTKICGNLTEVMNPTLDFGNADVGEHYLALVVPTAKPLGKGKLLINSRIKEKTGQRCSHW